MFDLQSDILLAENLRSVPLPELYSSLKEENFQQLKRHAQKLSLLLGSTYVCEQTFSVIKFKTQNIYHTWSPLSCPSSSYLKHSARFQCTCSSPKITGFFFFTEQIKWTENIKNTFWFLYKVDQLLIIYILHNTFSVLWRLTSWK